MAEAGTPKGGGWMGDPAGFRGRIAAGPGRYQAVRFTGSNCLGRTGE